MSILTAYYSFSGSSSGAVRKSRCTLPYWFAYITYVYCSAIVLLSIIVVLLYGDAFGRDVALRWLLACFCSFLQSFFILEPMKVVVVAAAVAIVTGNIEEIDDQSETPLQIDASEKIKVSNQHYFLGTLKYLIFINL